MISFVDTFILERLFTPIAWWVEQRIDRTNFWLAWWCVGICVLCVIGYWGLQLTQTHDLIIADVILGPILLIGLSTMLSSAQRADEQAKTQRIVTTSIDAMMPSIWVVRLIGIGWTLYDALDLPFRHSGGFAAILVDPVALERVLWFGQIACITAATYFMSVARPPPSTKRQMADVPM